MGHGTLRHCNVAPGKIGFLMSEDQFLPVQTKYRIADLSTLLLALKIGHARNIVSANMRTAKLTENIHNHGFSNTRQGSDTEGQSLVLTR